MDSMNMINNQEMMWMMLCMIVTTLFAELFVFPLLFKCFYKLEY